MRRSKPGALECNVCRVDAGSGGRLLARVAVAADLHDRPCEAALAALRAQSPDFIAVPGDLMECPRPRGLALDEQDEWSARSAWRKAAFGALMRADALAGGLFRREDISRGNENAFAFLEGAAKIAPTVYSLGNHDRYITPAQRERVAATGAVLLDNGQWDASVQGVPVRFGGLTSRRGAEWLARFSRGKGLKILLCHHPEAYDGRIAGLDIPVVLSGHAHGGQWRLFGLPLFAPGQGFFPKYTSGVYGGRLVVSRGMANTAHVPRFGNPAELLMAEIYG